MLLETKTSLKKKKKRHSQNIRDTTVIMAYTTKSDLSFVGVVLQI